MQNTVIVHVQLPAAGDGAAIEGHPAAAGGAANDAHAAGEPGPKFARYNTAEKKDALKEWRSRDHECKVTLGAKQCHRQWQRGYFAGVGDDAPGHHVGRNTRRATPVTVWDANVGNWAAGEFHRVVLSRSEDPDMAAVVVGDHVVVAPLALVRKLPNA